LSIQYKEERTMGDQSSNQIVSIDPEREEKVAELVSTA
jgi:hypothetical protein